MNKQYSYPLDLSWSTEELASVLSFFNDVEAAYEGKVEAKKLLDSYKGFKAVVPSKSEEKRLGDVYKRQLLSSISLLIVNSSILGIF